MIIQLFLHPNCDGQCPHPHPCDNNHRDGDRSREQSSNTAVMGFRFSGNTPREIKVINATDVLRCSLIKQHDAALKLSRKSAASCAVVSRPETLQHETPSPESLTRLHNCSHISSVSVCGQLLWPIPSATDVPTPHVYVVMDIGHILCSLVTMFGFVVFGSYVFV